MNKFEELGIIDEILKSIEDLRFENPTDIQKQAIPLALEGKDVIAGSATGSGKTLVFASAIIQNVQKGKGLQALILTPTRELAIQIYEAMLVFSKYKPLRITSIYGGVSYNPQFHALERADVVVGTPGRILDHLQRGTMNLSKIKHFVLDEADRMLDMGFFDDVHKIMSQCPKYKQTTLFSATIPPDVKHLAERFMNNPVSVNMNCYVDPKKLKQVYYDVPNNLKLSLLVHLVKKEQNGLVMVFCNSRHGVEFVEKGLRANGLDAVGIHGGLTQNRRSEVMKRFNSKKGFILVCTDVAARGLDIPGVSQIYNFDIPHDSKQYVHRIGRTARAGESGIAINILSDRDHDNFSRVLRDFDVKIEKRDRPYLQKIEMKVERPRRPKRQNRGRFGPRKHFGHRK